jgi:hypothetical protein
VGPVDAGGKGVGFDFAGKIRGMTTEAGGNVSSLDVRVVLRQNGLYIGMTGEAGTLGNLCRCGCLLSASPKSQARNNNQQKPESSFHNQSPQGLMAL